MSIPTPAPFMSAYPQTIRPVANVTPFTYRDGLSYLKILETLIDYVNTKLVGYIQLSMDDIVQQLNTSIEELSQQIAQNEVEYNKLLDDYMSSVEYRIMEINNKTGELPIRRYQVTDDMVVDVDPVWPDRQQITLQFTQDYLGHDVEFKSTNVAPSPLPDATNGWTSTSSQWWPGHYDINAGRRTDTNGYVTRRDISGPSSVISRIENIGGINIPARHGRVHTVSVYTHCTTIDDYTVQLHVSTDVENFDSPKLAATVDEQGWARTVHTFTMPDTVDILNVSATVELAEGETVGNEEVWWTDAQVEEGNSPTAYRGVFANPYGISVSRETYVTTQFDCTPQPDGTWLLESLPLFFENLRSYVEDLRSYVDDTYVPQQTRNVVFGSETTPTDDVVSTDGGNVIMGYRANKHGENVDKTIAIGPNSMVNTRVSSDNIAIGAASLREVQSEGATYPQPDIGIGNIAIGGNAGRFINSAARSVVIGRNAGQSIETGVGAVCIGNRVMAGYGPIGLGGHVVNSWAANGASPKSSFPVVGIGNSALARNSAQHNTAVGPYALFNNTQSRANVAIGSNALRRIDEPTWLDGHLWVEKSSAGTYNHTGETVTVNMTDHGMKTGDVALIHMVTGASANFEDVPVTVTVLSGTQFTFPHPNDGNSTGNITMSGYVDQSSTPARSEYNTAVGYNVGSFMTSGQSTTLMGREAAGKLSNVESTVAIGALAGEGSESGSSTNNTIVGVSAMRNISSVSNTVALGWQAGYNLANGDSNTLIGYASGRNTLNDEPMRSATDVTTLGAFVGVSGSKQTQLNRVGTNVYAHGAIQDRSDIRDKTDIRDTELGLDFIEKIRPVDFRWNMRDSYPDGDNSSGEMKGHRYHHGVIAQQVEEAGGGEFGGLQHHSVNGGLDVYSMGYTEFIGPLIKAVQELSAENKSLKDRIEKIEEGN